MPEENNAAQTNTEAANNTEIKTDSGNKEPETKPQETKPEPENTFPEKYELKLKKDSYLSDADIQRIEAEAKKKSLSNEAAQELLDRENDSISRYKESQSEIAAKEIADWPKQAENDKEIGGKDFKANVEHAKRVVDKYATKEFKQMLDDTGFGNHPEVLRMFVRIAKDLKNDSFESDGKTGSSSRANKSMEEIFYGKS